MPLHRSLHLVLNQPLDQVRAHNVLPESLLLQKLQVAQSRSRVCQVFQVRRLGPILEVVEVSDEGGLSEELLRREVVEIVGIGERLDKLQECRGQYSF